jgi:hypothetical protein
METFYRLSAAMNVKMSELAAAVEEAMEAGEK